MPRRVATLLCLCLWPLLAAPSAQTDDRAGVTAACDAFYAAMKAGDRAAAMGKVAPDAVFLEGGRLETRAEYERNHLPADIEFERAVASKRGPLTITISGNTAWVVGTTEYEGTFENKPVNFVSAQLMVLTRTGGPWMIRAVHWSALRRNVAGAASPQPTAADIQQRFVGNWRLLKFENFDESGAGRDAGYESGRIMYDAAGNMAAQLMRVNRKPLSQPATEAERAAAYAGYVAYFGKYTLDTAATKVTHHVEGSTNPNWPKTDLVRYYAFSPEGHLLLSIRNAQGRVTGTLTWQRIE